MAWTEDRVAVLRRGWIKGLSATQIARQLGGVTRNAVIGKLHRTGLNLAYPRTGVTDSQVKQRSRKRSRSAYLSPAPMKPPLVQLAEPARTPEQKAALALRPIEPALGVLGLSAHTCRHPIGDPKEPGFAFCGRTCEAEAPYCVEHAKLNYQPAARARRKLSVTERLGLWLDRRGQQTAEAGL